MLGTGNGFTFDLFNTCFLLNNNNDFLLVDTGGSAEIVRRLKMCNIELKDVIIPEKCPVLEIPFIQGIKGDYQYTYSLDRIDNTKGYIKGNIQVITNKANSMKNSATIDELKVFCENMLKIINEI